MHTMKRHNFFLPEKQMNFLKNEAKNKGIRVAELLRRIIDFYIEGYSNG